jgi:hypothetical protein
MLSGFDRSQADVIDSFDQLRQKPENVGLEKLAAVTLRPRRPFIMREDFTLLNVLIASIVGAAASVAIDLDEVASGESGLAVGIDTILVGFAFAGISFLLTTRLLRREQTDGLGALQSESDSWNIFSRTNGGTADSHRSGEPAAELAPGVEVSQTLITISQQCRNIMILPSNRPHASYSGGRQATSDASIQRSDELPIHRPKSAS